VDRTHSLRLVRLEKREKRREEGRGGKGLKGEKWIKKDLSKRRTPSISARTSAKSFRKKSRGNRTGAEKGG